MYSLLTPRILSRVFQLWRGIVWWELAEHRKESKSTNYIGGNRQQKCRLPPRRPIVKLWSGATTYRFRSYFIRLSRRDFFLDERAALFTKLRSAATLPHNIRAMFTRTCDNINTNKTKTNVELSGGIRFERASPVTNRVPYSLAIYIVNIFVRNISARNLLREKHGRRSIINTA